VPCGRAGCSEHGRSSHCDASCCRAGAVVAATVAAIAAIAACTAAAIATSIGTLVIADVDGQVAQANVFGQARQTYDAHQGLGSATGHSRGYT